MFSQLLGNENVKVSLTHLLRSGRLPNSLLFAGPTGVGKKQFAVELARAFVCQNSGDGLACENCAGCARVGSFHLPTSEKGEDHDAVFFGEHPDVGLVVPYKRNLRVGAIRALEREANFRPYEARARVFIIDDADKMNDAASNALLKTLEEPALSTYLILITSRPNVLLSTIRSRCQTIRFSPTDMHEIEEFLVENRSLRSDKARLAARVSNGSIGRALEIAVDDYRSQRMALISVLEKAFIRGDRAALLRSAEQLNDAKNKELFEANLAILESLIRDMWMLKLGRRTDEIRNIDEADKLRGLAFQVDRKRLELALEEIESIKQALAVNINRKAATDALFMKISA